MTPAPQQRPTDIGQDYERKFGFHDPEQYVFKSEKGLTREIVERISEMKHEPDWMRAFRLGALERFLKKPMPTWANVDLLGQIRFDNIHYFLKATDKSSGNWADVPDDIRKTYEKLGIPEAEQKFLGGVSAQYESEVVYHSIREDLTKQGVIFTDMDTAVREHPAIVQQYFATIIPPGDNKFAALNSAVWSGGSFIYVPKGIHVEIPLQAYFRINAENMGQFERTLIIADEGALVEYIEGCTAPVYSTDSLHSAVVELIALPHAKIRYTTIQNWSKNVYNLVTKRAVAYEGATVEWIDGNLGCVREGELVYTECGPRPIETVEPGTRVWSFDEQVRRWVLQPVVARKDSGMQPVYEVACSNGRTIHLTENHPLLAVHHDASRPKKLGRYALRWTPLQQLVEGDFVMFPTALSSEGATYRFARPSMQETFVGRNQYGASYKVQSHGRLPLDLPTHADEDISWMLGLWLAEGDYTVEHGANGHPRFGRVGWSVPKNDRARDRLVALLNRYVGNDRIENRKDGIYFRINSLEFALWLQTNGFVTGARKKRVPSWLFGLPTQAQRSFLAGYLDGDGCAVGSQLVVKSASKHLLSDVQMLSTLCDIHASTIREDDVTLDINGIGRPKTYHTHALTLTRVEALRPFLTHGLRSRLVATNQAHRYRHPAKMRATDLLPDDAGVTRIVSIRPSIVARTYDLEIEGTSSFVVNGILVHNSKLTMKYPAIYLLGEHARGEVLSVAFSGKDQHQDAGAKIIHAAPNTTSTITSKSISKDGGRTTYRGLVKVYKGATGAKSHVRCDALLLDERSRSDTYPTMEIDEEQAEIGHEASVSKIGEEQLFYLMSRGLKEHEAATMIVNGFFEPFAKALPLEYAVELNRLIQLEMEGSVG